MATKVTVKGKASKSSAKVTLATAPAPQAEAVVTPQAEPEAPAATPATTPAVKLPWGGKTSRDPEHQAKMIAGTKARAERERVIREAAKAEANKIIAEARAQVERTKAEATAQRIIAKAEADAARIRSGAKLSDKVKAALPKSERTEPTYDNPVHAAFNFYTSIQGDLDFWQLDRVQCTDTTRFYTWLATKLKSLRPIALDGYDYALVLRHRLTGHYVTMLAADGIVTLCGYTEDAPESLRNDLNLITEGFTKAVVVKGA